MISKILISIGHFLVIWLVVYYIVIGSLREVEVIYHKEDRFSYNERTVVELVETKRRIVLKGVYGKKGEVFYIRTFLP